MMQYTCAIVWVTNNTAIKTGVYKFNCDDDLLW